MAWSVENSEESGVERNDIKEPLSKMFFATSILHVHLMQWDDDKLVEQAVNKFNKIWDSIESNERQQCIGLLFYNEFLHIFYRLRLCDYKNAAPHVDKLDAAMKADMQRNTRHMQEMMKEPNALNQSLSCLVFTTEKGCTVEKQALIEEQLRSMNGFSLNGRESLEPVYFGNVRRTPGDNEEGEDGRFNSNIPTLAIFMGGPSISFPSAIKVCPPLNQTPILTASVMGSLIGDLSLDGNSHIQPCVIPNLEPEVCKSGNSSPILVDRNDGQNQKGNCIKEIPKSANSSPTFVDHIDGRNQKGNCSPILVDRIDERNQKGNCIKEIPKSQ
ncbi:hypothetical protein K1719_016085 [Acacia pycnantha]|nr:hypothetical protein K1719_016085 [Acacia pycnantha]